MVDAIFRVKANVSKAWARRVVEKVLRAEKAHRDVSVLITTDREIRKINKKYLKHDFATDVVSFDTGDLIVSAEYAKRYAREHGIPYREEIARYLVHGTLHLLGYDDKKKKDHARMHERQESLLRRIL